MRKKFFAAILFAFLCSCPVMAQTGIAGVWQSDLETGAGRKLDLQIVIAKLAGGAYGITVHYMEGGAVKNLPATSVSFAGGKLAFSVKDLGGSFSGTLENKTIAGRWNRGDHAAPMVLKPFTRSKPSSRETDRLLGEWVAASTNEDGFKSAIICRFEKSSNGELVGFSDIPDSGMFKNPIANLWMDSNQLRFQLPLIQVEITGELKSKSIVGRIKLSGQEAGPIELIKGKKYQPQAIRLDLTAQDMKKLQGRWIAKLGAVTIVFRFEQNAGGNSAAYVDVPEQNVNGMRIYRATFVNDALSMKGMGVEYKGTLNGNTISGTMTAMGQPNPFPVVVTKE